MAYPISELILQNVADTLATITTFNSYSNNLIVEREQPDGNPPLRNGLCIVMGANAKNVEREPVGFERKILPVGIVIYCIEPEGSDQPVDQILFGMAADVRKALLVDLTRGDNAENTVFDEEDKIFREGAPPNILLVAKVQFRHLFGDPYNRS